MYKSKKMTAPLGAYKNYHKMKKIPWKTLVIYYVVGLMWVLFSDRLFAFLAVNYEAYIQIQSYKGIFYVTATTVMLFFLIRMDYAKTIKLHETTEDLYLQKQFVDEIYNSSNTVILVWDEKNEIIKVNKCFLELFEMEEAEVLGTKWYSYILPEENPFVNTENAYNFISHGSSKQFESTVKLKSGKIRQLLWNVSAMKFPYISDVQEVAFGIDISAEKKNEALLYEMAYTDSLTGLKNRSVFDSDVLRMIDAGIKFVLFYLDLDNFKNLNDVYGHECGDEFIKEYAKRLEKIVKKEAIYRWYGDKFLILDIGAEEERIVELVHYIADVTKKSWNFANMEYYPSVSIGITKFPADGNTLADMKKNADMALFRAKGEGKSKVVAYEKNFQKEIEERIFIENKISEALLNDGFKLNFQPIYNLEENRISGMEILLRWKADNVGISTGQLIEVAEETGKILLIDFWVIEHAFRFITEYFEDKDFMININLSARSINSVDLLDFLIRCMSQYAIRPENVEFEITEHSLIHNMEHTKQLITELKKLGFKFSLDDFGTRYSSLNYLCSIPFDTLKIDKSYIDHILYKENEKAVIEQIIQLSKRLGLKTIAEGIEQEEQRHMITMLGCDFGQGYLMARPMEKEKLLELLEISNG